MVFGIDGREPLPTTWPIGQRGFTTGESVQ
jgi:hypothetical protein